MNITILQPVLCVKWFISSSDPAQQTIYEYHRVEIDTTKITGYSAVELTPLPSKWISSNLWSLKSTKGFVSTVKEVIFLLVFLCAACLLHDSCELCLSSNQTSGCSWCNVLQRWVGQFANPQCHSVVPPSVSHKRCVADVRMAWIDTDKNGWTTPARTRYSWRIHI